MMDFVKEVKDSISAIVKSNIPKRNLILSLLYSAQPAAHPHDSWALQCEHAAAYAGETVCECECICLHRCGWVTLSSDSDSFSLAKSSVQKYSASGFTCVASSKDQSLQSMNQS